MKANDFVSVHTQDGTIIGRFISDEGVTCTIEFGTVIGKSVTYYGVPKDIVTEYVSI